MQKVCEHHKKCCINLITLNKDMLVYEKHQCYRWVFLFILVNIRGVTGGTDQTSGVCSLCYTIPI